MATAVKVSASARGAVDDYEIDAIREGAGPDPKPKRPRGRLNGHESFELECLWLDQPQDIQDVRSAHGAITAALLRSPPQDLKTPILHELARAGGRAREGAVIRILLFEKGSGTRQEIVSAIHRLAYVQRTCRECGGCGTWAACVFTCGVCGETRRTKPPRIERVPVDPLDVVANPLRRSPKEQERMNDDTGFELRLTERGEQTIGLAMSDGQLDRAMRVLRGESVAERRWRMQDEALERDLHTIEVNDESGGGVWRVEDMIPAHRRIAIEHAMSAIAKMPQELVPVLRWEYGHERPTGMEPPTEERILEACREYRAARRARK